MPRLSKIDQAIGVLEAAAQRNSLSEGQLSRIAALSGLIGQTRPQVEGALSDKNTEKPAGILSTLEKRLGQKPDHYTRPEGVTFAEVKAALEKYPALMQSLSKMEDAGGAPDVVAVEDGSFIFADCSAESPSGRRGLNYDEAASQAAEFGVELMKDTFYKERFQKIGTFDSHSWSWLETSAGIKWSGALLGVRFGDSVHVNRHAAENRNSFQGWRGVLRVSDSKITDKIVFT